MSYLPQIIFLLCLAGTGYVAYKRFSRIRKNILLGKKEDRTDRPNERLKQMLLMALGQKKMFQKPLVGFMHMVIYLGFIIINIEILEIVLDGLLGTHRLFQPFTGSLYDFALNFFEILALGVIVVCLGFLARRNVLKIRRFWAREMTAWPRTDANLILIAEIVLMTAFLTMNAADAVLQDLAVPHYVQTNDFVISGLLKPLFQGWGATSLIVYERGAWWLHILGILGFAVYITYSKHLHIVLGFPNTYYGRLQPAGEIKNMPAITKEVKLMLGLPVDEAAQATEPETPAEPGRFGAKDINDLTWKNLMDAYSCTECGRCTAACPANQTGKLLSPRKIMMDTRDRMEDVGASLDNGGPGLNDGKSLYGDYILKEEIMACTTCNACVEACPVNINPLEIIVEIRRYVAMEEASTPASWNMMFANTENNGAPWAFPASDRANWRDKIHNQQA